MISAKQRTIALCAIATAAVIVLFASAPLIATYQAHAFWGGWGWNRCAWFGCGVGSGGWFPWGPPTPAWNG
jgi:hypothetical protein